MAQEYFVRRGNQTLTARLYGKNSVSLEIAWKDGNAEGRDIHYSLIKGGKEIRRWAEHHIPDRDFKKERIDFLVGYVVAFETLGSELRKQLPEEWLSILGDWLTPKKEKP